MAKRAKDRTELDGSELDLLEELVMVASNNRKILVDPKEAVEQAAKEVLAYKTENLKEELAFIFDLAVERIKNRDR